MLNNQKTYNLNQIRTRLSNSMLWLIMDLADECSFNNEEIKKISEEIRKVNGVLYECNDDIMELISAYNYGIMKVLDEFQKIRNIDFKDVKSVAFNTFLGNN